MGVDCEAIILAGGLGTRLKSVVSDVPKCMAPINGIPFIDFIISYLKNEGVSRFILSLGYKSEMVIDYVARKFNDTEIEYVIEDAPLGTGGAIQMACSKAKGKDVLILNGDTLFNIDIKELLRFHRDRNADFTAALKEMHAFSRYGSVTVDTECQLLAFNEKQYCQKGLINGGVYALNIASLIKENLPAVFSFEKDFLERFVATKKMFGLTFNRYFIDIGIPEDYNRFINDYELILSKTKSDFSAERSSNVMFFYWLGELFD